MKKRISRILGLIMLIIAIAFIEFALNHPEMSFPWNNTITWLLYGLYILVTVMLLMRLRRRSKQFAFVERSGTMKAPVGLLSDRTVLRSKMEGPRPDKFQFAGQTDI